MPKEIANKVRKEIYIKCKKYADEVFGDTRKKMTYCKCKTIAIDGCEDYIRVIGNKGDYQSHGSTRISFAISWRTTPRRVSD